VIPEQREGQNGIITRARIVRNRIPPRKAATADEREEGDGGPRSG
jgi:hypothetical protein